jgi:fructose-1,6-bisphosphatase/inositol monophosphatase family enzyme
MENLGTKSIQFAMIGIVATLSTFFLYRTLQNKNKRLPIDLTHTKYTTELLAATEVALEAGENMISSQTVDNDITIKGDNDFVTKTDLQNETMIHKLLTKRFPTYEFIGEVADIEPIASPFTNLHQESVSSTNSTTLAATPTWIVDPIDG